MMNIKKINRGFVVGVIILVLLFSVKIQAQPQFVIEGPVGPDGLPAKIHYGDIKTYTLKDLSKADGSIGPEYSDFEWVADATVLNNDNNTETTVNVLFNLLTENVLFGISFFNLVTDEVYYIYLDVNLLLDPATPPAPIILSSNCDEVVLQRADPPNISSYNYGQEIKWYWQSTADGTSIVNSDPIIRLTSSGQYFLRARVSEGYAGEPSWSTSSSSIECNVGSAAPTVETITQPTGVIPTGSVVLSGLPIIGEWLLEPVNITGTGTTKTVTGLTAGTTYNFRVTNSSGCISNPSVDVVMNGVGLNLETPILSAVTQPTCYTDKGSFTIVNYNNSYSYAANPSTGVSISGNTVTAPEGTYTFTAISGTASSSTSARVTVNGSPVPAVPTVVAVYQPVSNGYQIYNYGSVNLTDLPAGTWTINPGNISGSGSSRMIDYLAPNIYNYTVTNSFGCVSGYSTDVAIYAHPSAPIPPIVGSITQPTLSTPTGSVILTGLPIGTWTINPGNITGSGVTTTITGLAASATYRFTMTNSSGYTSSASADVVINALPPFCGPSSSENYIHTIIPTVGTTDINTLSNDQKQESVTYFDGLGRPMQSVGIRAGVKADGSVIDIITHIGYDGFGRQEKEYLPYKDNEACGVFRAGDIELKTKNFYNTPKYENTANPYSQKEFEASPLNRVLRQAAPGYDWRLGSGHEIKLVYDTNSSVDAVKNFEVSLTFANNTYMPTLTQSAANGGFYVSNELYKTVTYDENATVTPFDETKGSTVEFKNKQGQVVLKRTYGTVGAGTTNERYDTYYVYDDYGNLTYVIPPKASGVNVSGTSFQANISSNAVISSGNNLALVATNTITLSTNFHAQAGSTFTANIVSASSGGSVMDDLCYQYKYDQRNRLVEKKLPGKGWEYIVYDKLDRPILSQDANLKAQNKWIFTKYDAFSRVVYTGEYENGADRVTVQNQANAITTLFETKQLETNIINGTMVHYSNTAFPKVRIDLFTINYYDDYDFDIPADAPSVTPIYGVTSITNAKGLTTGSKVRALGTTDWITNVIYYDAMGRAIYNYSKNDFLGVIQKVKSYLDFVGKVKQTTSTYKKGSTAEIAIVDNYSYDHIGRLLTQNQSVNGQTPEVVISNSYDELGQLVSKGVGGNINQNRLQTINYTYNIRGWLKGINDVNTIGNDLFSFKLSYNDLTAPTPLYNGNISQSFWKTANTDSSLKNYDYIYDGLNRLTNATDNQNRYSEALSYDLNGNIMALKRNGNQISGTGNYGAIDDLKYEYLSGNRLNKVVDATGNVAGFKDVAVSVDYDYDVNGNMTSDTNKSITSISYNHLNLPVSIQMVAGTITYDYDATGVKLRKKVNGNITDYAGGFQYYNGTLQFFSQPEGYVDWNNGNIEYIYQYKDHLGNVRLAYKDGNKDGVVDSGDILSEDNYYPFGLKQRGYNEVVVNSNNKYKYNGKELQDELGLNMYDYGARNYDPALGRWMNIDPLAEKSRRFSPYTYALNNPIFFIDPDGMEAKSPIFDSKSGAYLGNDSQGFLKGEVLFMDKEKFSALKSESKGGIIDHSVAVNNSQSISELKSTKENMILFNQATDFIDKTLYKAFYGENPTKELFGGRVQTASAELGLGTASARPVGTEYGNYHNVAENVDTITQSFDNRKTLNTAANIFSNFEHEFRGHGGRADFNISVLPSSSKYSDLEHKAIYKMQMNSPNFKFTSGAYRQHILNANKL